ncbi:MAG: metalloregulator ArsR/SmtB family transcription factor [Candidatus Margulisiibacteriota bacterium]|jgi:ArsR family transcriptional regulator
MNGEIANEVQPAVQEAGANKHILFLRSLANDERIKILKLLMKQPIPAQEVEKLFYMEQSTASYHLNMMRKAGILECRKEGKKAIYSYVNGSLEKIFGEFLEGLKN